MLIFNQKVGVLLAVLLVCLFSSSAIGQEPIPFNLYLPLVVNASEREAEETGALLEVLKGELNKISSRPYKDFSYERISKYEDWMYGYFIAQENELQVPDVYGFLVRKSGQRIEVAYQYTDLFDDWLDIVPNKVIALELRHYMYSSQKYKEVMGASTLDTDEPQLSFPWREQTLWRYTSGPHHKDGPGHNEKPWSGIDFGIPYGSPALSVV